MRAERFRTILEIQADGQSKVPRLTACEEPGEKHDLPRPTLLHRKQRPERTLLDSQPFRHTGDQKPFNGPDTPQPEHTYRRMQRRSTSITSRPLSPRSKATTR